MSEVLQVYIKFRDALKLLPKDTVMPDGMPIAEELERVEKHIEAITPKPPVKCFECGLMSDDPRCCQNDEDLWK